MTARFSFDARFYVRGQTGAEGGQFGGRGFMVWCLSNVYEKLLRQQSQPRLSMEAGASCHPVKQKHLLNVRALI